MKFNTKFWIKKQHLINSLTSEKTKNSFSIIKASVLSILFGLLIGIIIIFINGENGFAFIASSIEQSLSNDSNTFLPTTLNYFSTYALMGIGLALGFKIGLFNMGGTGQAVIGMTLSVLAIGNKASAEGMSFKDIDSSFVINVFFIFIFSGIAISLISGILKVAFNIHEVVTTVMLNWVVWIFSNWLFDRPTWEWSTNHSTEKLNKNWVAIGDNIWVLGVILTLISVLLVYILVNLTTFGYKFKVAGKQPTAAKYAGINMKYYIILTTALQGLFISMGGFIYYMTIQLSITTGNVSMLPTIGFDAIPIALVAFSNVFGILPVAFLWAMLKNGSDIAKAIEFPLLSKDVSTLVFGAITYGAGISALFYKLNLYQYIYKNTFIFKDYNFTKNWFTKNKLIWKLRKQKILIYKNEELLKFKNEENNKKNILKSDIKKNYDDLINLKKSNQNLNNDEYKKLFELIKKLNNDLKSQKTYFRKNYRYLKKDIKTYINFEIKKVKEELNISWDESIIDHKKYSLMGFKKQSKLNIKNKKFDLLNNLIFSINNVNSKKINLLNEVKVLNKLIKDEKKNYNIKIKDLNKNSTKEEYINKNNELKNNFKTIIDQYKIKKHELKKSNSELIKKMLHDINVQNKKSVDDFIDMKNNVSAKTKENVEQIKNKFKELKKDFNSKNKSLNKINDKSKKIFERDKYINKVEYYNKKREVVKNYVS
ncbi:ribose/galactose ABC transporter permease [Spiroplasma litorale]|uniref:Ribose/galactose ABC transporter permease n=1 Tax=Spiroplasma litorale TaxID=216942 RepID=A0A0K1W1L2_9MOLU|nr:ABC transporter permease [Spiroplasma litorale]AKX33982.1 ribose/galactose ABC transporter permease [Spiroplasma litorale]